VNYWLYGRENTASHLVYEGTLIPHAVAVFGNAKQGTVSDVGI